MSTKLAYALNNAKGKTIEIPKEKIAEELYHQRISILFENAISQIRNREKDTKEETDRFLQKEIQTLADQTADDFYNACLHTYMNKYYATILKIQDFQHENEKKEYHIPSEPPEELTEELQKARQDIKSEIYQRLMEAADSVNIPIQSESILKQYLERELKSSRTILRMKSTVLKFQQH